MTTTKTLTSVATKLLDKSAPKEIIRLEYAPPEYTITHAELDFDLDETHTQVRATLSLHRMPGTPAGCDLVLDGEELKLKYVSVDGADLKEGEGGYRLCGEKLRISGQLLPAAAEKIFKVSTHVEINPSTNLKLMGLYKTNDNIMTQCEAEGFRRITYYLDRPDVMSMFRVRLEGDAEKYPVLLSNGNCTEKGSVGAGKHFAIYVDPFPKPCYLFALVAGNLKCLTDTYQHPEKPDSRKVEVNIWCEPQDVQKLEWAMESIKRAMRWDEDTFGLAYDLDVFNIVCSRDFNMGAMENKSLNIFVSSLILATPETATDADYLFILRVIGHEYFHNWTGDRVTCRDWFQLTLKEGLTVFRDQFFSGDMGSRSVTRISTVQMLKAHQFVEDSGPLAHPIRPESYIEMDNFYTVTVYKKGAEVVRMYETILGKEGFRKGMDLYFKRYDGRAVTCDDFRSAMADANGVDFTQFERWYLQSGTPEVTVCVEKDAYDKDKKTFTFSVKQSTPPTPGQPNKLPYHIPIRVGLIGRVTKEEISPSQVFHLKKTEEEFVISNVMQPPVLSILRDFSAPVKLNFERDDDDLALLFGHDTDDYNRFEAGQSLALRILVQRAKNIQEGKSSPSTLPLVVVDAFRNVLLDGNLDKSFRAHALVLPEEEVISQQIKACDPLAIYEARQSFRKQLREALYNDFLGLYKELSDSLANKPYQILPASENVAPRQLRNLCLAYLCCDRSEDSSKLAFQHFMNATNMTDKLAGLRALVNIPGSEKERALKKFYDDAKGDPLVLDKWFTVQAGADVPNMLNVVKTLTEHPEFTMKTPSRMRAVIFRFGSNRPHFHALDGSGYKYIADAVMELDDFNSSMSSKCAQLFAQWKNYDEKRQGLMKGELERILKKGGLSSNLYEIVTKALA